MEINENLSNLQSAMKRNESLRDYYNKLKKDFESMISNGIGDWDIEIEKLKKKQEELKIENVYIYERHQEIIQSLKDDIKLLESRLLDLQKKSREKDLEIQKIYASLDIRTQDELEEDINIQAYFNLPATDHLIDSM